MHPSAGPVSPTLLRLCNALHGWADRFYQRSRPLLSGAGRELHLVSFKSDEALVRGHKWQSDSRSKCLSRCRKTFSCVGAPECPQVPFSFIRPSADSAMPSLAGLAESATAADPCLKYGSTGPRTEWLAGSPLDFARLPSTYGGHPSALTAVASPRTLRLCNALSCWAGRFYKTRLTASRLINGQPL